MKSSLPTLAVMNFRTPRWVAVGALAALVILLTPGISSAVNGTWTGTVGGSNNWADTSKWSGGNVANGSGASATFNTALAGAPTLYLDQSRTLGSLTFGDLNVANGWILGAAGMTNVLTLDSGSAAQPVFSTSNTFANVYYSLAGTQGVLKTGAHTLWLLASNTFSGVMNVAVGTLRIGNAGALGAYGGKFIPIVRRVSVQ